MNRNQILEILIDWNFWKKDQETGLPRETYLKEIKRLSQTNEVVTVTGSRRSGKSTLMLQYIKNLIKGGLCKEDTLYVNFEDPRFSEPTLQLLLDIYDVYKEQLKPQKKPYIFLDEVQKVKGWEKFVNSLYERKEAHLIVSGSASELLSAEFGSVLTGRHLDLEVFPLSFKEFLVFKGLNVESEMDMVAKRTEIKHHLTRYLEEGGFPKTVLIENTEDKKTLLKTYFNDIISRDVVKRYKVKEIEKLEKLAVYYLSNTSTLHSFNSIQKFIGLSSSTIERFSHYLSNAYMLFFVQKFAYSLKEQSKSPKKVYCIDTGLKNAVGFRFREELGRLIENVVFLELMRKGKTVYYWRDRYGYEVDFVIKKGLKPSQLIQVCWDLEKSDTKNREIRALLRAKKSLKVDKGLIISWDCEKEEDDITYIPLWKWLIL